MLEGIFTALTDDDEQPLRDWLTAHGVDVESLRSLPQWNADSAPDTLRTAIRQGARSPAGIALVLIFLLRECEQTWEVSYHYGPIWEALRDGAAWRDHVADFAEITEPDQVLASAAQALLEIADLEIQVENAMTSGSLDGFGQLSRTVAAVAAETAKRVSEVRKTSPACADFVEGRSLATRAYYDAAAEAGTQLYEFLSVPGATLRGAIDRLAAAERDGSGIEPNRASELRAHRFSLAALQSEQGRPWLHVESGQVLYIYPFSVSGSPVDIAERTAAEAADWDLAGVTPTAVHASFNLDDVWDGTDTFGRSYDGTQVELPRVTVRDLAGNTLATLDADLRLSRIGNHYVRLAADLSDAGPEEVYAAMFRAAPEHGTVRVSVGGSDRRWDRLSDLANDLATAASNHLLGGPAPDEGEAGAAGRDHRLARRSPYHVIVTVDAASVSDGPAGPRREILTHDDLSTATGAQVLTNPVTHCVSALAEWSRYPMPGLTNILSSVTHRDDVVLRTANTTVFVALGSPSFHTQTRVTVAEFVASVDGLFAGWSADLSTYFDQVEELLGRTEDLDPSVSPREARQVADALRHLQQQVRDFVTRARSTVALIESPGLVSSPVVSAMKAGLLDAAGFGERAQQLDRQVEQVLGDRLVQRIDDTVRALEEGSARRQRARMDTALAVVAAVGISGLGQIIQAGYDVRAVGALWITLTIVGLAGLFGLGVRWSSGGRRKRQAAGSAQLFTSMAPRPRRPLPGPVSEPVPARPVPARPVPARD